MIVVRTFLSKDPELVQLELTLAGKEDIEFFRNFILQRALNLAQPENPKVQDWLALCDKCDEFLERLKE